MNAKTLFPAALVMLAVALAGCSSPQQSAPPVTTLPGAVSCGFTTCHGADVACGTHPPQVCTADYQLGDKCRQYAACTNANGTCSLVTTTRYDSCRSCIQKCGGADPAEIFGCEEQC